MKTKILLLIVMLLMFPVVSAGSISINPLIYEINLTGGETVQLDFNVVNNGDSDATIQIETTCPNGEGIEITYSVSHSFSVNAHTTKNVKMYIKSDINVAPDTYIITIDFSADVKEEKQIKVTKSTGDNSYVPPWNPEPEEEPSPYIPDEEPFVWNENCDDCLVEEDSNWNLAYLLIAIIIILGIILTLLILINKRREKQNEKN